jgi:S-adenosyl methyltransferase
VSVGQGYEPLWDQVDLDHANVARVYDYYLGGTTNYAVDRVFAERALERFPFVRPAAQANRLFLRRAVRHLIKRGVRQFVDIGSGVPTMNSAHQVARELTAAARVVSVDNEPVAVAHSQILLDQFGDPGRHAVVQADLREPEILWAKIAETGVIDLTQPIALLLVAVLHVTQPGPDGTDLAPAAVAEYCRLLPPGSYLALSHGTVDGVPEDIARQMIEFRQMYDDTRTPLVWRSRSEIEDFFGDLELIDPGVTWTTLWHPEEGGRNTAGITFETPAHSLALAGVAKKH